MDDGVDLSNAAFTPTTNKLNRVRSKKYEIKKWCLRSKGMINDVQFCLDTVVTKHDLLRDDMALRMGDLDRIHKNSSDPEVQLGQMQA